jgi:hypothetical protein
MIVCVAGSSAGTSQEAGDVARYKALMEVAKALCDVVKEAKGSKTTDQVEAEVKAKVGGFWGKIFDVGGGAKGTVSRETFDGLTQEEMAKALKNVVGCRERTYARLLNMPAPQPEVQLCCVINRSMRNEPASGTCRPWSQQKRDGSFEVDATTGPEGGPCVCLDPPGFGRGVVSICAAVPLR